MSAPCDETKRQDGPKHGRPAYTPSQVMANLREIDNQLAECEPDCTGSGPEWVRATAQEIVSRGMADPAAEIAALRNMLQRIVDECSLTHIAPEGIYASRPCLLTLEQARAALNLNPDQVKP